MAKPPQKKKTAKHQPQVLEKLELTRPLQPPDKPMSQKKRVAKMQARLDVFYAGRKRKALPPYRISPPPKI